MTKIKRYEDLWIGAHLSVGKGISSIQEQMESLSVPTCAIFIKSPRQSQNKYFSEKEIALFKGTVLRREILVPHAPYILNLANETTIEKNIGWLENELDNCMKLGIKFYNIHPGSDVGKMGKPVACKYVANAINKLANQETVILLENMAGQGNTLCSTFEELAEIIKHVTNKARIGVCLDTAHLFASGYDIRTESSFKEVIAMFDKIVGLEMLKAWHLNDSKTDLGSRVDRHEQIGKGKIGIECFKAIVNDVRFRSMPMILETPDPKNYKKEIDLLHSFVI